ncbi:porin [Comamonas composti]|uniref:porin n=1 Tax=Comamonas composti TaxID=408558 RepID=UPI00040D5349|nr:porin [Comamonas composti]
MKWQVLKWLPVAALAGAAGLGHAQNSVTVYGRVVSGVAYQSNIYDLTTQTSGNAWRTAGNEWGTSFWGFKGNEDLGGGLSALFQLEGGFALPDGASSGLSFGRRATVGFKGGFGTIKLGREIPVSDAIWALDPSGQQTMGSATLVNGRNWQGHSNMIYYETPSFGGFSGFALTSLGEQAGSFSALRKDAVVLAYTSPSMEFRVIYDSVRDANGGYSTLYTASKHLALGGSAQLGPAKLFAAYETLSASEAQSGPTKATQYWLGARYQPTSPLTLVAAAYRTTLNNDGGSANLFLLGSEYSLSKRTVLYASVGRVMNSGNAAFGIVAEGKGPLAGGAQNGFYAGVAHSF